MTNQTKQILDGLREPTLKVPKEETTPEVRLIPMEQFYSKENGIVYWNYRFNGGKWNKEETACKELPYLTWKVPTDIIEDSDRLRKRWFDECLRRDSATPKSIREVIEYESEEKEVDVYVPKEDEGGEEW